MINEHIDGHDNVSDLHEGKQLFVKQLSCDVVIQYYKQINENLVMDLVKLSVPKTQFVRHVLVFINRVVVTESLIHENNAMMGIQPIPTNVQTAVCIHYVVMESPKIQMDNE